MIPIDERRDELEAIPNDYLIRLLLFNNPMGGYSIGTKRGQLTRMEVIETILRYEGYKQDQIIAARECTCVRFYARSPHHKNCPLYTVDRDAR